MNRVKLMGATCTVGIVSSENSSAKRTRHGLRRAGLALAVQQLEPRLPLTATSHIPAHAPRTDDVAPAVAEILTESFPGTSVDRQGPSVVRVGDLLIDPAGRVVLDVTFDEPVRVRGRASIPFLYGLARKTLRVEPVAHEPIDGARGGATATSLVTTAHTLQFSYRPAPGQVRPPHVSLLPDTSIKMPNGASIRDEAGNRAARVDITKVRVGDPMVATLKIDGTSTLEQTYRTYGVDRDGHLFGKNADGSFSRLQSDAAVRQVAGGRRSPVTVAQVQLLEREVRLDTMVSSETTDRSESIDLEVDIPPDVDTPADLARFYKNLWDQLRARDRYRRTPAALAREIADFDRSLEELRADASASGLSLDAFVASYETVDRHFKGHKHHNVEGELDAFLEAAEITPAELLAAIGEAGTSWNVVLRRMASNGTTFVTLFQEYAESQKGLGDFLREFVSREVRASRRRTVAAAPAAAAKAAKVAVDAAKLGLDVAKFAWEVIKDGRPKTTAEGAYTRVLSNGDPSFEKYANSVEGRSRSVEWEGRNLFNMRVIHVKYSLGGYYGASHPTIGGKWLPSVGFKVDESYAFWGFGLNVGATITAAANVGSADSPEPVIQVVAQMQASGWFQSFTKSITLYANGATGFRVEV